MRPATSSQRNFRAAWRYCRMRMIRPSRNTGITTTDPGWVITSRTVRTPVGSSTSSRRTPKIGPLYMTVLRRILPVAWFVFSFFRGWLDFFGGMSRGVAPAAILSGAATGSLSAWDHPYAGCPIHCRIHCLQQSASLYSVAKPMAITTIIIDDEKPARDELAFLLKGFPEINVIGQGKNGVEAVSLIKEHAPDLVFLDVKMPGLDGFGVLKKIVERKMKMPHVVFATAFDQYAVQAFYVNAVDYG